MHAAFKYSGVAFCPAPLRAEWLELWAGLSGDLATCVPLSQSTVQEADHLSCPSSQLGRATCFPTLSRYENTPCSPPLRGWGEHEHHQVETHRSCSFVCYPTPQSMSRLRPLCRAGPLRRRGMGPLHTRRVANARGLVGRGVAFKSGSQPWDGELQVNIGTRCVPFVQASPGGLSLFVCRTIGPKARSGGHIGIWDGQPGEVVRAARPLRG
jgi:hypothetical protein